jgi:hypothetical protein
MTTDCSTTGRTAPFLLLCSEEWFHPLRFNGGKIFKKTHPEQRLISGVYLFEVLTGIVCAFITKCYGVIVKTRTSFFQKGTVLIPGATSFTVRHADAFTLYVMLYRKISTAYVTIHPTRGDKILRKLFYHFSHHEIQGSTR